jgi:hypothetical protein
LGLTVPYIYRLFAVNAVSRRSIFELIEPRVVSTVFITF